MAQTLRRVAIVGSREGVNPDAVRALIDRFNPLTTVIISGGARGVDSVAADHARSRGMRVVEIRPNWKKHGRGAGFHRNTEIVLAADDVVAFWDGNSRGTFDTMRKARKHGRTLGLFDADGELIEHYTPEDARPLLSPSIKTR